MNRPFALLARCRRRHTLWLIAAALMLLPSAASAEYRLAVGDVIEISVISLPELHQISEIDQDGEILLPLGGTLQAKGLTLPELRKQVRQMLPTKEFYRQSNEGHEYPIPIAPGEVQVRVAEYRPVYLNGDVAKPGEQPFRPGLTVRQAIALAGGYDVMRFRMNNPFLEQSDLKGEYNSLWMQFAQQQLRVASLEAELQGKAEINSKKMTATPLPASVTTEMAQLERDKLNTDNDDYAREKAYLKAAVAKEDQRMSILSDQQKKEGAGVQEDAEDVQRVQALFKAGNGTVLRLLDARRSLLLSSTRQLQTQVFLAAVERERQDFNHKAEKVDDQRRLAIIDQLQQAKVKLAGIRAHLEAVGEKLVYVGMVRSQLVRGDDKKKPNLTLFRKNGSGGSDRLTVTQDDELQPGDVIDVSLAMDVIPGLPAN